MDLNGVLSRCVDASGNLAVTTVAGTPEAVSNGKQFDENFVWSQVFDPATSTIRVISV